MERRQLLKAVGTAGAAVPLLAACGDAAAGDRAEDGAEPAAEHTRKAEQQAAKGAETRVASVADIPVGGGKVFKRHKIVVTQPIEGEFKAFSSQCTHGGCQVSDVSGGSINCRCHDSRFEISDGSVLGGPARRPLSPAKVAVKGDDLVLEG